MRTILYYGGRQYRIDSIEPATHVVMLALNKAPFNPVEPSKDDLSNMSAEEADQAMSLFRANRKKFVHEEVSGRFDTRPGVWIDGEDAANKRAEEFRAEMVSEGVPKYSEVIVVPVSSVNPHA